MIELNKINERMKKEKEKRYGISLVDMQFTSKVENFEKLIDLLQKKYFIKVSANPHVTLFRCKSSSNSVNVTFEINRIFEEIVRGLNNVTLIFDSLSLDDDGVIRVRHKSNIRVERKEICSDLGFTLIKDPWITLGRMWDVSNLENDFENIREIIREYCVTSYIYKPCEVEMVLFRDILFEDITTIKKYRIDGR